MRKFLTGIMCLATGAALWCATPDEAQAQKRGGGGGNRGGNSSRSNAGHVTSTPSHGGEWHGSDWHNHGDDWWRYIPYGVFGYGGYGYRPYESYYPRGYGYNDYPSYYDSYPTTTESYSSYYPQEANTTAQLRVQVPDPNAQIWLNGAATKVSGTSRVFVTPPLSTGYTHTYEVRARWMDANGQMRDQVRNVEVQPGQEVIVNFS
jgi:uncharacterized protein (TIGR03000 family)